VYAQGLQLIRVSDERVVLKKGIHELLLDGSNVGVMAEPLLKMLDGTRTREQIVEAFPGHVREDVDAFLTILVRRGFVGEAPTPGAGGLAPDTLQSSFYQNFGHLAREAHAKLQAAGVLILGSNLITRSMVRSLLEMGLGRVTVVSHPVLDNHVTPAGWNGDGGGTAAPAGAGARFQLRDTMPPDDELSAASLLCAACDLGEVEALLESNRAALRLRRPFLPVWINNLIGYVGPLNYPNETACLRCHWLRADSNNPKYELYRRVRRHISENAAAREGTGLLPPMAGVVGEIAAMEVGKAIGGFVPSDTVGRLIEVNLVSFQSKVRRVLKVPRCPDCSEVMARSSMTLTHGPQIAHHDD
jgi:bacteriocin biosynthesis cyclodehydratase domain-containing protein